MFFVSGQVDWSLNHKVQNQTVVGQTRAALEDLKAVLGAAHSSLSKLQVRIYVRGEVSLHMEEVMPVLREYLMESQPALTGVGVSSLASPDLLVGIEAIAELI